MATEVERKFLVIGDDWKRDVSRRVSIRQAYLSFTTAMAIRVRIIDEAAAFLTIKSAGLNVSRSEFEYSIPLSDAEGLMALRTGQVIRKQRHIVPHGDAQWEIDVFEGEHAGLVIAEIELRQAGSFFERPAWLGKEVTGDPRYYNVTLAGAQRIGGTGG